MKKVLILLTIFILAGCSNTQNDEKIVYKTINQNQAEKKLSDGAVLIDVRTEEEYQQGNIKNSINIPLNEIETLDYEKDTVIIVYCRSGARSKNAANVLINNGYTNVYDFGSIDNWVE